MNGAPIHLLLVEDDPQHGHLFRRMLGLSRRRAFAVETAETLSAALDRIGQGPLDVVLLDLDLIDSHGLDTYCSVQSRSPALPVIVLTSFEDEETALQAVHEGAQDYLLKGEVDAGSLERSILYAIERRQAEAVLSERTAAARLTQQALHEQAEIVRSVLNSVADAIIVVDNQGRFLMFNPEAARLCGYGPDEIPAESWPPRRVRLFRADGVTPYPLEWLPSTRARRGEIIRDEEILMRVAGRPEDVLVSVNATPLRGDDGTICGGVAVLRDITQRRRSEEQIRRLNAELERRVEERTRALAAACEELEAFSYSVSHDLRAPLRVIEGFSQALLDDCGDVLPPQGHEHLVRVRSGVQNMGRLIDALLDLSRTTRAELRREPVCLSSLAAAIAGGLQASDPRRQVAFEIAPHLRASVDRRLAEVLLHNLLENAWKFTARAPHPRIEFAAVREEGETVYRVRDNGAGFDMAEADRLFVPFQRLHRRDEYEGMGIGLATVRRIVQRHGGRVWAESGVGQGATVCFTLGAGEGLPADHNGAPCLERLPVAAN